MCSFGVLIRDVAMISGHCGEKVAEAIDGVRSALFRNDCLVQAVLLAEVAERASLASPPSAAVRSLPALPPALPPGENRTWLAELAASSEAARAEQAAAVEEKLRVLREEHAARVEERRRIMERQLVQRLADEQLRFDE